MLKAIYSRLMLRQPAPPPGSPGSAGSASSSAGSWSGRCQRYAAGCTLLAVAISFLALMGWLTGWQVFAGRFDEAVPMAPATALTFLVFCSGALLHVLWPEGGRSRPYVLLTSVLVALWGAIRVLESVGGYEKGIEEAIIGDIGEIGDVPVGYTTPVSGVCFVLVALAQFLIKQRWSSRLRNCGAVLPLLVIVINTWFLWAYLALEVKQQLEPDHTLLTASGLIRLVQIPVAIPTALSFLAIALGLIVVEAPSHFLFRPLVGSHTQARLLRAFLPGSLALIVGSTVLGGIFTITLPFDDLVTVMTLWILGAPLLVGLLLSKVALRMGQELDRAQAEREHALEEMCRAKEASEAAYERLRKAHEELSRARDAAETANRTKSQFLANMNHELRTPLNSIILYAEELMVEHQGEAALVADLQVILDRGKHLIGLINDILEHAKLEANMVKLDPTTFPVVDATRDVITTLAPLAEKNGNNLRAECPSDIGKMHADVMRVKQCLLNLLSNANKFTSNGTITLQVSREEVEGRVWITFRVADTGIGMTPEQQARIFKRFAQADASTTRRYGGTGLGLSISRGLSELMGGTLFLERSEPNVGSTFTLRLPVGATPTGVALRKIPSVLKPLPDETPATILVIDDDADVREMLIRQLSKEGFQAIACGNGEEALSLCRQIHPQVITLDVMMPGMDGWSVLSALKSDPTTADIPVVIVSIIDDKNLGYALGASDYLVKPVPGDRLADVLKRFCHPTSTGLALIAEDDPVMRDVLRRVLEKEKWTVVEANNGREALDHMAQHRPSLILLDLMMPEMDGMEFLDELQHHPEWSEIPVVIITAKELAEEERMFLNGSILLSKCVKRVLKKGSFSREELLNQVRQLVARGASVCGKS